jgi:hypothetical protein
MIHLAHDSLSNGPIAERLSTRREIDKRVAEAILRETFGGCRKPRTPLGAPEFRPRNSSCTLGRSPVNFPGWSVSELNSDLTCGTLVWRQPRHSLNEDAIRRPWQHRLLNLSSRSGFRAEGRPTGWVPTSVSVKAVNSGPPQTRRRPLRRIFACQWFEISRLAQGQAREPSEGAFTPI